MSRNDQESAPTAVGGYYWQNGVAFWKVTYEYADADGGGERIDYFKTINRRTPPSGAGIERCLNSDTVTLLGVEQVEFFWVDLPEDRISEKPVPDDAAHPEFFDLSADTQGAGRKLEIRE
jgi:hypothetical protein